MNTYQPLFMIGSDQFYIEDIEKEQWFEWFGGAARRTVDGKVYSNRKFGQYICKIRIPFHDLEGEKKVRRIINTTDFFYFWPDKSQILRKFYVKVDLEKTIIGTYCNQKYIGYLAEITLIGKRDYVGGGEFAVTSPNGGESWTRFTTETITWTPVNESVNILYNANSGVGTWLTLASGINGNLGGWNWLITQVGTVTARIKIVGITVSDMSDADFTIINPA